MQYNYVLQLLAFMKCAFKYYYMNITLCINVIWWVQLKNVFLPFTDNDIEYVTPH